MKLRKTTTGRYYIEDVPALQGRRAWVVKDQGEWHVYAMPTVTDYAQRGRWVATGHTRTAALEIAAQYGWK